MKSGLLSAAREAGRGTGWARGAPKSAFVAAHLPLRRVQGVESMENRVERSTGCVELRERLTESLRGPFELLSRSQGAVMGSGDKSRPVLAANKFRDLTIDAG
jgi:hypothetical protein